MRLIAKPAPDYYPCGHPRTSENTVRVGVNNGVRCKKCRREITKRHYHKVKKAAQSD